jgi:hypothetical protein
MRKFRLKRIPVINYRSNLITPSSNVYPESGDPDDDDFSFAGFDWISFADRLENAQLTDQQSTSHQGALTWIPLSIELRDGSSTIGFKIQKSEKDEFDRLTDTNMNEAQKFLLSHATQVLTTPSKTDRMRGIKAKTLIVRTPSSLIDLLDDEVPDLREGMVYEPQDPRLLTGDVRPLSGTPWGLILELAHAIFNKLSDDGHNISMGNLLKALGRLAIMGNGVVVIGRLISAISSGELSRFITDHANEDIYDCITDWYSQFLLGEKLSNPDLNRGMVNDSDHESFSSTSGQSIPSDPPLPNVTSGIVQSTCSYNGTPAGYAYDRDYAVVPVKFWRYLYHLGDAFSKKDREPNFSRLALTGSPGTDLLLNRVPSIFIHPDGSYSNDYSRYAYPILCGGLFKKIKNAVKKVGKVVGKVGAAVAKGVAKVMDGPLGGVISAIPVVGNIASVAGKVAKGVTKVIDKVKSVKDKISSVKDKVSSVIGNGDSESNQGVVESLQPHYGNGPSSADATDRHAYGAASGVEITKNSEGAIDISSLPVWSAPSTKKYHAPTVSFLTGDGTLHLNPHAGLGRTCRYRAIADPSILTPLDQMRTKAKTAVYSLSNVMRSIRHPDFVSDIDYMKSPSLSWLCSVKTIPYQLAGDPFEDVVASEAPHLSDAASYFSMGGLTKTVPSQNPLLSILMQMYADNDTRKLFALSSGAATVSLPALTSYLLNPPYAQRFNERGMQWPIVGLTSVAWALLIASSESLSDESRKEASEIMRRAAESGCFTGKGVDALLTTILKGEWPNISEDRTLAKTWVRCLASAIAWMWSEANSTSINALASALTVSFVPSYQITSAFLHDFIPKTRTGNANGSENIGGELKSEISRDEAIDKASAIDSPSTQAGKDFDALLTAIREGSSDPKNTAYDTFGNHSSCFSDMMGSNPLREALDPQTCSYIGDMWDAAVMAIKTTSSWQAARMKMMSIGLPASLISTALEKFYGAYDNALTGCGECDFLSIIPLTREDSCNFEY